MGESKQFCLGVAEPGHFNSIGNLAPCYPGVDGRAADGRVGDEYGSLSDES